MRWVPVYTNLVDHPKTRRLGRRLSVSMPEALGLVVLTWHFAIQFADDGDLSSYDAEDIAVALHWDNDAEKLVEALVDAKWLERVEGQLRVNDWHQHVGQHLERAQKRSEAASKAARSRWGSNAKSTPSVKQSESARNASAVQQTVQTDRYTNNAALSGARHETVRNCDCGECDGGWIFPDRKDTAVRCPNADQVRA